jgi:hypothetical protein
MASRVRVKNLAPLQKAFILAGADAPVFAAHALREEADEAFALSQTFVPVRTGVLRASGQVHGPRTRGSKAFAEITYGGPAAPYAIYVHEIPPSRASHDYPTRWKYLENPVREYAKGMGERMTRRVLDMIARKFEII